MGFWTGVVTDGVEGAEKINSPDTSVVVCTQEN